MKALTSSECKRKAASPLVLGSNAGDEAVPVKKKSLAPLGIDAGNAAGKDCTFHACVHVLLAQLTDVA